MVWSVVTPWLWADTCVERVSPGGVTIALEHTVEPGGVVRPPPETVLNGMFGLREASLWGAPPNGLKPHRRGGTSFFDG